jgi:hypothetical protein
VFDRSHGHDEVIFVDLVKDAVRAASGRPRALERRQQDPFADTMRIFIWAGLNRPGLAVEFRFNM